MAINRDMAVNNTGINFLQKTSQWKIGKIGLHPQLVVSMAVSSLRIRIWRSMLTVLTIATTSGFMMYLLTAPRTDDPAEDLSWKLMLVLAFLVSTAGVLNTMLMSVTQRYREIGTMKCLGAIDLFIMLFVILEAVLLGIVGVSIGGIIGFLISFSISLIDYGRECWCFLRCDNIILKSMVVLVTGIFVTIFGAVVPAWIASKMPPIEAMRGEK